MFRWYCVILQLELLKLNYEKNLRIKEICNELVGADGVSGNICQTGRGRWYLL